MQKVTIRQMIEYSFHVDDVGADDAIAIGNMLLQQCKIPLEAYELIEADVTAEEKNNVIPLKAVKRA